MPDLTTVFGISSVLGFLGALPQVWGSNWKEIWLYRYRGIVAWEIVHASVKSLLGDVQKTGFAPSMIVGVGRGGIVCSGIACSELTTEQLLSSDHTMPNPAPKDVRLETINSTVFLKHLPTDSTNGGLTPRVDRIELKEIDFPIDHDETVLLMVAQNFHGSTLKKALGMVLEKGLSRDNVKTAAIFWHRHPNLRSEHDPDFVGRGLPIDKTMPWKDSHANTDRY